LCLAGLLCATAASARLGGDEASIYLDAQSLSTVVTRQPAVGYTRYDLPTAHGAIHQYAGPSGQVFAITFAGGPTPPLELLLGSYLETYRSAVGHAAGDHRSANVDTPTLKAFLHGRPFSIAGKIWLPPLTPAQVSVETLP
jgi:hypothetical protein